MGKLLHVVIIFTGTEGLFLPINKALKWDTMIIVLGKGSEVRVEPIDISAIVISLTDWPAHVK